MFECIILIGSVILSLILAIFNIDSNTHGGARVEKKINLSNAVDLISKKMRPFVYLKETKKPNMVLSKVITLEDKQGYNFEQNIKYMTGISVFSENKKYWIYVKPVKKLTKTDINLIRLIFNDNSLEFLKYQNFDSFIKLSNQVVFKRLNNWYKKLPIESQENILFGSGIIALFLGLRQIRDVDIIHKNAITDKEIKDNKQKMEFLDIQNYDKPIVKKMLAIAGVKNINDVLNKSENHVYIFGYKCWTLDTHIKSRQIRSRPKAIAELITISETTDLKPIIPKIPDEILQMGDNQYITDVSVKFEKDNKLPDYKNLMEQWDSNKELANREKMFNSVLKNLRFTYKLNVDNEYWRDKLL